MTCNQSQSIDLRTLEVHIDGVVQNQNTYNIANDDTFTTNPNLSWESRNIYR